MADSITPIPTVILAGGYGTRLSEETEIRPKPMVEIGGRPILWHIMQHYAHFGHNEFYVALGYKGEMIKRYFLDYYPMNNGLTINLANGEATLREKKGEDWTVHLEDTGVDTNSGGRILRLAEFLRGGPFMLTYGDGVGSIDINNLLTFHRSHKKLATITAVRPPARFGTLEFDGDDVVEFKEKSQVGEGWINGGFMVCEPGVLDYFGGDEDVLEIQGLERLASDNQVAAYRHEGFWQCMDTIRDVKYLRDLWREGSAPWRTWK